MLVEQDAGRRPRQQPRQFRLALAEWQRPQILAVELQKIECVQHRIRGFVPAMQRIECGYAVGPRDHRLAVQRAQRRALTGG
jgi:hypothetical protein